MVPALRRMVRRIRPALGTSSWTRPWPWNRQRRTFLEEQMVRPTQGDTGSRSRDCIRLKRWHRQQDDRKTWYRNEQQYRPWNRRYVDDFAQTDHNIEVRNRRHTAYIQKTCGFITGAVGRYQWHRIFYSDTKRQRIEQPEQGHSRKTIVYRIAQLVKL